MTRTIVLGAVIALGMGFTSLGIMRAAYAATTCKSLSATFNDQDDQDPLNDRWELTCDGDCDPATLDCEPFDYGEGTFEYWLCRCGTTGVNDMADCRVAAWWGEFSGANVECSNYSCNGNCPQPGPGTTATCPCQ